MPIYVYTPKQGKGKVVEQLYPMGQAPATVTVDGIEYERNFAAEQSGARARPGDLWPLYSEAAGVHPEQVAGARQEWQKRGVPTDFTADGRAIFRDAGHRRKFLKAAGLVDRRGFN